MPVIVSLNSLIKETSSKEEDIGYKRMDDMPSIISNITFNILKNCPGLVADISAGLADHQALKKEIIKDIDKNRYHLGIYRDSLIKKVFDFMFGYGELQQYVDDEDVSDIDGTSFDTFIIKRKGKREKVDINFGSENVFETYCKLIAIRNGGILNENDSHCRVTDSQKRLRINISIKPRNISGPSISIRKHRHKSFVLDDLEKMGMITAAVKQLILKMAVENSSLLFCGRGGAGKTTLMRAFINSLPEMERVLIAESDAEIFPDKPYCIEQRIKKPVEGGKAVTLRDLVRDGLTMSLDTYCVGEITGDEAWEFVKAAYTGHRGIATTHSESAEDAFGRLLTLSKGAGIDESENTVKQMLAKSIDYIFYLKNFAVTEILRVIGYSTAEDCFSYERII